MEHTINILTKLIRAEIDEDYTLDELFLSDNDIQSTLEMAQKHSLAHLVSDALKKTQNIKDEATLSILDRNIYTALLRHQILEDELKRISNVLEHHKIPYIPLKGSIICNAYPKPWMRSRRDIDILVTPDNHQRACEALSKELEYTFLSEHKNDMVFTAPNTLTVEVHHHLIVDEYLPQSISILNKVWERSSPDAPDSYRYKMDSDMFVYHHLAHMAKHCLFGGCGIRPILDLWIISKKFEYMSEELREWLKQSELLLFAESIRELCEVWFSDRPYTPALHTIQEFIVTGGEMGNENIFQIKRIKNNGGKNRYFLSRLILPYSELKEQYPITEKHKCLVPFCQLHRLIGFLFGKRRNIFKDEFKKVNAISKTDYKIMLDAWKHLGIEQK